jgi:hypothetical protein
MNKMGPKVAVVVTRSLSLILHSICSLFSVECPHFREGKSRMVQRQQQIWENPVREKHYSLFCWNMPARECLEVILLWGAKELVVLFYQLKAGHIYTYGLFVHVSMHM